MPSRKKQTIPVEVIDEILADLGKDIAAFIKKTDTKDVVYNCSICYQTALEDVKLAFKSYLRKGS